MKNIAKYILAAVASITMLSACDLNIFPESAIAYDENGSLIQTSANLTALETGLFSAYRSFQNGDFVTVEEAMFDGFNAVIDFGNNFGGPHRTDYTFTSSDYDIADYWIYSYSAIKDYNIFIAKADDVPESIADAAKIAKGEAYFFRAATYLGLARRYAKAYSASASADLCVPLVLVYDQLEKPARATVAEVYAQIKKDLDDAATLLAGVAGKALSIKPTIDAVNALYARYYLDIKDYANAATYAHKVIDGGKYKLASTAKEMDDVYVNDAGSEAIMQLAISLNEFTGNNFSAFLNATSDPGHTEAFRPYFIPTKTVIDSYESGDLRLSWYDNTTAVLINGSYYNVDDKNDFYTFVKFRGNPKLTSTPIRNARQAPKPFKISEMYLIAAEAELSTNATAAKADLNALQDARGASKTEATLENIQKEWMKETIGEGLRMSCLKRWGLGFSGRPVQDGAKMLVMTGEAYNEKVFAANSNYFQWPIPSYEININSNLVQNEGFGE